MQEKSSATSTQSHPRIPPERDGVQVILAEKVTHRPAENLQINDGSNGTICVSEKSTGQPLFELQEIPSKGGLVVSSK